MMVSQTQIRANLGLLNVYLGKVILDKGYSRSVKPAVNVQIVKCLFVFKSVIDRSVA